MCSGTVLRLYVLTKHTRLVLPAYLGISKVATPLQVGQVCRHALQPHTVWGNGVRAAILVRMKLIAKWILSATALLALAHLYPGVVVNSFGQALVAALVIGLFNALLRPLLIVLTLPVTILTLGLFLFVINALMFWAAASVLDGFAVTGFGAALVGSLIYTLMGVVINSALERLFPQ